MDPEFVDVVFEENATHDSPSRIEIILNWLTVPLVCVVLSLYLRGIGFATDQGWTDADVVDELESHGAEIVKADRNFHRILGSERRYWSIGHWAFVVMAFFGTTAWIQFTTPWLSQVFNPLIELLPERLQAVTAIGVLGSELIVWYIAVGTIMTAFFVAGTTETRNYAMMRQIENYVDANPDSYVGCLIVGGAHAPHLKELIRDSDRIEIGQN